LLYLPAVLGLDLCPVLGDAEDSAEIILSEEDWNPVEALFLFCR